MVTAKRYRNRRSAVGAGPLLWGLLLQDESFEVFKKKTIRLIVCGLNTTNIRFSFTFRMKMEMGGPQSRWTEPQGSGQSPNAAVSLMPQWQRVSFCISKLTPNVSDISCNFVNRFLGREDRTIHEITLMVHASRFSRTVFCYYDDKMNKDSILLIAGILVSLLTLIAGYLAGQRGRSNAIATTVDRDWLQAVAEDLAEFIELQIDIVWKRWRIKDHERTTQETSSQSYENEAFRTLQESAWKQTFRSDLLKSKLLLMLDDLDDLQKKLIGAIDDYSKPVPEMATRLYNMEKNVPEKELGDLGNHFDLLLREKRPLILDAGRRVLAAKRDAIRKSV